MAMRFQQDPQGTMRVERSRFHKVAWHGLGWILLAVAVAAWLLLVAGGVMMLLVFGGGE